MAFNAARPRNRGASVRRAVLLMLMVLTVHPGRAADQAPYRYTQRVPVTIDGERLHLLMRIHRPVSDGRRPTLIFNHGSTGSGTDAAQFARRVDLPVVASWFVERGWAVVIPARRGRGGSEGVYDEGFSFIRSWGYSCLPSRSLAGADRALQDIAAAVAAILEMPFVDQRRIAMGGVSRGGILSIAYAGAHPAQIRAVVNFVGGWLGWPCPTMGSVNRALFRRGAAYPGETLWLYAENDPYYALSHSRSNHAAFTAAGGRGRFQAYVVPGESGHRLPAFPELWGPQTDAYLARMGLPNRLPLKAGKGSSAAAMAPLE